MSKPLGSANGARGCILRSMIGELSWFRVYDENHDFVDYKITHHDLSVVIDDESAHFYEHEGEFYLDYSPDSMAPAGESLDF